MSALPIDIERLALIGWHLYPCVRSKSKAAMFKGATDAATCDLDQLERWAHQYPVCNWRVVCGPSKIWGLDLDVPSADHGADGVAAFARLTQGRIIPPRPMTRSGGGGLALFFRHDMENITGKTGTPEAGIDPRRGRLSVTVPPSIHHRTRRPYRWLHAPWEIAPPIAPNWLVELVQPPPEPATPRSAVTSDSHARRRLVAAMGRVRTAGDGGRNDTLNRATYSVARDVAAGTLSEAEATECLYAAAIDTGLPRPEAIATIKSAMRAGMRRPRERV